MNENGNVPEMEIMLNQMVKLYEQKLAEIERLSGELKVLRLGASRLQSMLRLGGVIEAKPATKKKPSGVREDTMNNVLRAIHAIETPALDDVPYSFTAAMMVEATGHSGSVTRRVIDILREQGVIRLAGMKQGEIGKSAQVYALVDA